MTERNSRRDMETFAVWSARRQRRRHAPDQFFDISGLLVELSEPCDSTHVYEFTLCRKLSRMKVVLQS